MKKLILILLLAVPFLAQSQSYPAATKVWEWKGTINAANVRIDTVVQYTGSAFESAGLTCACSFNFKNLNRDSSVLKMGGSDVILTSSPTRYFAFAPMGDSIFLRKAAWKQIFHARGTSDTTYIATVKVSPYGYQFPQFQWKKNGKVTSGTMDYKCVFSRN